MTFDCQDDIQVLLRLDEVSKVRCDHLRGFGVRIHGHAQVGFLWFRLLLLLLLLLLEHKLLPHLVEGLIVVLLVPDVVWHETRAHQTKLFLHSYSRLRWVHVENF